MPVYEYRCEKCGVFEVFQPIKESPYSYHPKCGHSVKRLICNTTFILKQGGTGWNGGVDGHFYNQKVQQIESGLLKEEKELKKQGHVFFPKGTTRAGDII